MAIRARYRGKDGAYHDGIPARDLTDEEYEALSTEQKRLVRSSDLYAVAAAESTKAEHKSAERKENG